MRTATFICKLFIIICLISLFFGISNNIRNKRTFRNGKEQLRFRISVAVFTCHKSLKSFFLWIKDLERTAKDFLFFECDFRFPIFVYNLFAITIQRGE